MFELRSENLTQLGGRMGTERTFDNWRKFFNTIDEAKTYAEKDFGRKVLAVAGFAVVAVLWASINF